MLEQWTNQQNLLMFVINIMNNLFKMWFSLKKLNSPEDMDAESSAHHELIKYQDAVTTADPEGSEYRDAD